MKDKDPFEPCSAGIVPLPESIALLSESIMPFMIKLRRHWHAGVGAKPEGVTDFGCAFDPWR